MILKSIHVDPLIWKSLESLAKERKTTRSQIIRDATYSAVWDWVKGSSGGLQRSPMCPRLYHGVALRLIGSQIVGVDEYGLVTHATI